MSSHAVSGLSLAFQMSNGWFERARLVIAAAVAVSIAGVAPGSAAAQSGGFVVVVNASNPTGSMSKSDLSKLFTKKTRNWPSGAVVMPLDLVAGNPVRDAFTKRVHSRSAAAIGSYWQQQIFSGRDVPPPERKDDSEVLDYVRTNAGAVGYVAAGTRLGSGVKALAITD
jgi:ABC-type phosphate transport system substrate-binding protein